MAEYTLYCFAQSGHSSCIGACTCGADWAPRWVDYFGGETRSPAYRAINETGEAPVLEHRGTRVMQSAVILDYLAETLGRFGADDPSERREVLRWLFWDNHKLTGYTATYRFMRTFAKDTEPAVVAEFGRRAELRGVLNTHHRPPFRRRRPVDDRRPVDVRLPVLADEIGVDWAEYPAIRDWLARISAELMGSSTT